jgi:rod shape-determining protein MreC
MAGGLLLLSQGGLLQPVEDSLLRPLSTLQRWISLRYFAIRDMLGSPSDIASLRSRNAQLEAEVARLEREVISLREQLAETEVLAALLGYARSQPESRYMAADVIGRDTSPFLRSIWIGRGSDSGIIRGMPVLTDRGLVGRVVEVTASTARVRLITDPETAVNVQLQDSRADGVLTPQLSGELWVDLIDQDEEISPGELVLTSGLGGGYPPGIPVGQVISVRKRDYELFQQAVIQPSVDFDQLEIVLVITNFRPLPVELAP